MNNNKTVLFKYFGKYAITSEVNYNRRIMDGTCIVKFADNCTKQEAINTIVKWGIVKQEDIIDKTGE